MLVDNYRCITDINVFPAEDLKEINEKFMVINTCSNLEMQEEVLEDLRKFVKDEKIYNVFEINK